MKTLLTLITAVVVASGYASASELHGAQLACNDKVKTASVQLASADEETTRTESTTHGDAMAKSEQTSNDQADTEDEGSGSAEPAARAEARGDRPQVDDEALWSAPRE